MGEGRENLRHVLLEDCEDPDCELHNPEVIEDHSSKLTALAWFYAGVEATRDTINQSNSDDEAFDNIRDELLHYLHPTR